MIPYEFLKNLKKNDKEYFVILKDSLGFPKDSKWIPKDFQWILNGY